LPNTCNIKYLDGLNSITSIGGYLDITHNKSLINLTGLENLNSISGVNPESVYEVSIYNMIGKKILCKKQKSDTVDVSFLAPDLLIFKSTLMKKNDTKYKS
jgi:hypothetical protein